MKVFMLQPSSAAAEFLSKQFFKGCVKPLINDNSHEQNGKIIGRHARVVGKTTNIKNFLA